MPAETKGSGSIKSSAVAFITNQAKMELVGLTNLAPSTVMGVTKDGEEWVVTIEMLEKKSIPDSMDILGVYEVRLNNSGEVLNFNRISLRKRGDTSAA